MNDISVWKNLFLVLIPLGILLIAAAAVLFIRNRLYRYLVVRAGQKGLVTEKKKEEKQKKKKTGPLPIQKMENKDDSESPDANETLGEGASGGRGKTEELKTDSGQQDPAEKNSGTTLLGRIEREASERSEKDDGWIPKSGSCQIIKKVLVTHARLDAEK